MNSQNEMTKNYQRAESYLAWNVYFQCFNLKVRPNWIANSDSFWYRIEEPTGLKYKIFNSQTRVHRLAFDHQKLVENILSQYEKIDNPPSSDVLNPSALFLKNLQFHKNLTLIQFEIDAKLWSCDLSTYSVKLLGETKPKNPYWIYSPNNELALELKNHNLILHNLSRGISTLLTKDGTKNHGYAFSPETNTHFISDQLQGIPLKPVVIWSPDSTKIITVKIDQTQVEPLHVLQHVPLDGSLRPKLHTMHYQFPGDEHLPIVQLVIIDIKTNRSILVNHPPYELVYWNWIEYNWMWWSEDNQWIYFIKETRKHKALEFHRIKSNNGDLQLLLSEEGETFVEPTPDREKGGFPNVYVLESLDQFIWWSQCDNWGHLYLYQLSTGKLISQITSGEWMVRTLHDVDIENGLIYFSVSGKNPDEDPYYEQLYRIHLDGSDLECLTHEPGNHEICVSTTCSIFLDTISTANSPPITKVKDISNKFVVEIERGNIDALSNRNWHPPQPFKVKARDNHTDIFGLMYFPSNFNPESKYPMIDFIYPGPQRIHTPKSFPIPDDPGAFINYWTAQSIAELGFIVMIVDGFGTPFRSKNFHDYCYNNLGDGGLADHVSTIEQLTADHKFIDKEKIGIFGHSGGGYASARAMMLHPDVYKVAVSSAGDHDKRVYLLDWAEKYMGGLSVEQMKEQSNTEIVQNLKGHLLIIHGEMDDNVHLVHFMRLIDAMIKNNKDFDMLLLPNRNHILQIDPYFVRKRWDYFVQHLLNQNPAENYKVSPPHPLLLKKILMKDF